MDGEPSGRTAGGELVRSLPLSCAGATAEILTLGATLRSLRVPDRAGEQGEVVAGLAGVAQYEAARSQYVGAVVGRWANRIAGAAFTLDGRTRRLAANEGTNLLHGGARGFDGAVWQVDEVAPGAVRLRHASPDGDQGFPGRLEATAAYRLRALDDGGCELRLDLAATCDAPTVVSLTSHAYWHLGGPGQGSILGHQLQLPGAAAWLPVDAALLPTGARAAVDGTPFDLRAPAYLGERLAGPPSRHPQLRAAGGLDHCLLPDGGETAEPRLVAWLRDPGSGRVLELLATAPGLQVYTGNVLDGSVVAQHGPLRRWGALCLEPQRLPDAPNRQPGFGPCVLRPGECYQSAVVWRLSAPGDSAAASAAISPSS